ncbi:ECF-type sigma factor [Aeoliella sp. ICT_H6.2]|uniref:ECF-type sigma factor n=1 Tax=Aeoliella straminimaris TaxID=2954799 RepID=A0A9X2FB52_9BACT|nr:ECF-type sigma factor [Aeoliella straminimaris]MCO6044933.1 ECF-type sigma factor [Aeoliella straminimaris]
MIALSLHSSAWRRPGFERRERVRPEPSSGHNRRHSRFHPNPISNRTVSPFAAEQLLPFVYDELRRLAADRLRHEKLGQMLQATAQGRCEEAEMLNRHRQLPLSAPPY